MRVIVHICFVMQVINNFVIYCKILFKYFFIDCIVPCILLTRNNYKFFLSFFFFRNLKIYF